MVYESVSNLLFGIGGEDPVQVGHFAVRKGLVNDVRRIQNWIESRSISGPEDRLEMLRYLRHGWGYYILGGKKVGERMAVRKDLRFKIQDSMPMMPEEKKSKPIEKWMSVGWTLLLIGGLAHMLPQQMEPLLKWAVYGITLQTAVGVLSVVIALYYLLGE
ncbi:MAG: hypothetical protein G01um101416_724 [Microgenomates group bacterium Gr01-1014_16]|nr:MAG: hypothetical protein G01um101416_724 [Microgenomates group bacterium Gr01-1014_16]